MQQQAAVHRIPMPRSEELAELPPVARGVLDMFERGMPRSEYKMAARVFVDAMVGPRKLGKASLGYDNPNLMQISQSLAGLEEYNPDHIPFHIYEKMRLDPQIALATAFIELEILAQNYRIDCSDETIGAFVQEAINKIYRPTVKGMLRAIQYGFSVGEKVYELQHLRIDKTEEGGKRRVVFDREAYVVSRVKFPHPSSIVIVRDPKSELIKFVKQTDEYINTTRTPRRPVRFKKCIWFAPEAEFGNFFGNSRYKAAYQPWYWSQIIIQFLLRYLERKGAPATVGKAPFGQAVKTDGETKIDNMDYMLSCTEQLLSNSNVVIPSQYDKASGKELWDINILEDSQRGEMFVSVLQFLNTMKARALYLPDKTGIAEGSTTNATAESHFDVHLLNEEALIQMIEDNLNESLIKDLVTFNFPKSQQVPCRIKIERLNFSKRTLLKDVFIRMLMFSSTNVREGQPPNWVPSIKHLAELLEIPGDEYEKIFLPILTNAANSGTNDGNDGGNSSPTDDNEATDDTDDEREDKVTDRNADSPRRKEETRRDRRQRQR